MKVFNFGAMNIDHCYSVRDFPQPGESVACLGYEKNCGGKGLNQSIALARSGAQVLHVGHCGGDGAFLEELMRDSGVDTRFVETDHPVSGQAVIYIAESGQNSIVYLAGANHSLTRERADQALALAEPGDVVLFQNETNLIDYVARRAKELGLKTVFNCAPAAGLADFPFDCVDMLIPNETEAYEIAGSEDPLPVLARRYPHMEILMTLGDQGGQYWSAKKSFAFPACTAEAVDTTGAGDTFVGYLIGGLTRGESLEESIALASAAAAIAIGGMGAARAIPWLETVLESGYYREIRGILGLQEL